MMVLVEMMVWMMMMMIPMKPSLTMVLMATVSPLREGIPPVEICLPERSFSLSVFRPAEAAKSLGLPALGSGVGPLWPISTYPFGILCLLEK